MNCTQIVPGSIADMAARTDGTVIPPRLVVIFDKSYSMQARDGRTANGQTTSRFMAGVEQLTRLQAEYPGQIVLIDFGVEAAVRPGGVPSEPNDLNTLLAPPLQLAKELDTGQMRFVVISDGQPYDKSATMEVAQTFSVGIDTIAIGAEFGGEDFLRELAQQTGGTYHRDHSGLRMLGQVIRGLLPGGDLTTPEARRDQEPC